MGTFRCVVCTPTGKLFDGDVAYANVPSEDGMFGVLPGHETLVGLTGKGGLCTVKVDDAGKDEREFLVFKGASQMFNEILTVLASFGAETKDIDRAEVEAHAAEMRSMIEGWEQEDSTQNKTRIAIFKRNLEWDEFQLEYLANQGA